MLMLLVIDQCLTRRLVGDIGLEFEPLRPRLLRKPYFVSSDQVQFWHDIAKLTPELFDEPSGPIVKIEGKKVRLQMGLAFEALSRSAEVRTVKMGEDFAKWKQRAVNAVVG